MNLFDITLHSLRRQKGKKAFLVAAMALSLCASLVLFSFVKSQEIELESQFDEYGANIVVTPHTDNLSLTYGGINLTGIITNVREILSEEVSRIYTIANKQNIRAVSPKLIGAGQVQAGDAVWDALIVGVDFGEESKIKAWWALDGRYPAADREIIAGATVAEKMHLDVGSVITIGEKELTVAGVLLATGSQDDSALLAPISFVEDLLDKRGKVSLVEVSALCSDCPIDDLVAQISGVLPNADVQAVRAVMEQRMLVVRQFGRFAVSIFAVLTILCGLFIFATITGAVVERRREIGVMRAVGFSGLHIIQVVLSEAMILGIIAGFAGIALTLPVLNYVLPILTEINSAVYDLPLMAMSFGILVLLSVGAAIAPAIKASRFDPVAAIASL
ncbi:MAG: FtsX-like permease family protein [Spirochaetales bacterium]|jgi:putative ABC transport system permease protein|nr:FtsX-like permease family protein [Spirochaetales bacterium]